MQQSLAQFNQMITYTLVAAANRTHKAAKVELFDTFIRQLPHRLSHK